MQNQMNLKEDMKAMMRGWDEEKKMTLLFQKRLVSENERRPSNSGARDVRFFDGCTLSLTSMFLLIINNQQYSLFIFDCSFLIISFCS